MQLSLTCGPHVTSRGPHVTISNYYIIITVCDLLVAICLMAELLQCSWDTRVVKGGKGGGRLRPNQPCGSWF